MLFAFSRLSHARQSVVLYFLKESRSALITATTTTDTNAGDEANKNNQEGGSESRDENAANPCAVHTLPLHRSSGNKPRKGKGKRRGIAHESDTTEPVINSVRQDVSLLSSPFSSAPDAKGLGSGVAVSYPAPIMSSVAPRSEIDHALQLHHRFASAMHQQQHMQKGETVISGVTNVASEMIERRRKKWTVSETEFEAGITERLFPEIRRLSALHELHYGDALMREVDSATYFGDKLPHFSHVGSVSATAAVESEDATECSLTDADFIEFDSTLSQESIPLSLNKSSLSPVVPEVDGSDGRLCATEQVYAQASTPVVVDDKMVNHGVHTPWFVPVGGVVRLEPLSPSDTLCILRFVMHLRQQTPKHLPPSIQHRMRTTEALVNSTEGCTSKSSITTLLSLEDVLVYLDKAPPPILGFTENLPPEKSPAFVFVLYTENISLQNATAHMAALFSIPQRAFHTHTAVSKMSCGAVLCAVAPNYLQREHLLLVNTMRHPGFILRIGSIRAVEDPVKCKELFGELSRWQPLHEVELLLRRVSCSSRHELEHRLRAVQEVGAVFFCANREPFLARAATDVLHGFFKSALLNALFRRGAPLAMRQFLSRPNVITAARARRVSTDAVVRQVLKNFILVDGDWEKTVARTPYVWRRRWLNALRCSVWNSMASRRMRQGGRCVLPGDIVLRPEYREDAHRRMLTTVKADHVMLIRDAEEAAQCSIEDVFIPFLRGSYSQELFAPETTNHPIMTRANMLALLREAHAPQLLLGLSDLCQQLLDIRSESSPLLFRRFIFRPVAMSFTILEDKAPMKSVHFDAARVLINDRLRLQKHFFSATDNSKDTLTASAPFSVIPMSPSLLAPSVVLERTTIGARLSSGLLSEEFFSPPTRNEYVALGHVERHLHGNFVLAAPLSSDDALRSIDCVYTIHAHAVVRHGAAALGQLLREYFILGGVEREDDSALQHKIHRVRRELDSETERLTAPTYCTACYCRDHDTVDSCAEYHFKRNRHLVTKRRVDTLMQLAETDASAESLSEGKGTSAATTEKSSMVAESKGNSEEIQIELHLLLRRRSEGQKWGVHLSSSLCLSAVDDMSILAEGQMRFCSSVSSDCTAQRRFWQTCLSYDQGQTATADDGKISKLAALRHFIVTAIGANEEVLYDTSKDTLFSTLFSGSVDDERNYVPLPRLQDIFSPSPELSSFLHSEAESMERGESLYRLLLRRCEWVLTDINNTAVSGRRQVAAVFVQLGKQREVRLRFVTTVPHLEGKDCGGASAEHHIDSSLKLPGVVELLLTKKSGGDGGWGMKIHSDSLVLLNLSEFLLPSRKLNDIDVKAKPSFLSMMNNLDSLDGRYVLRCVNGVTVSSQSDVIKCLQKQMGHTGNNKSDVLCLHLEQLQEETKRQHFTVLPTDATMTKKLLLPERDVSDGSGETISPSKKPEGKTSASNQGYHHNEKDGVVMLPPFSPQCLPLTPEQKKRNIITIVINRTTNAPPGRWGIRVERGTLRLQHIEHNRHFSFQVFASKQQQATRVLDTLRFNHIGRGGKEEGDSERVEMRRSSDSVSYSHFVYMIIGVNHHRIVSSEELRTSLADAASSSQESVVLQVQQYHLAHVAVNVERHESASGTEVLEPLGLRISRDMSIESVSEGGPMARGIMDSTYDGCSLRCLIDCAHPDAVTNGQNKNGKLADDSSAMITTAKWEFNLDEDAQQDRKEEGTTSLVNETEEVAGDLAALVAGDWGFGHWNMVDGVALAAAYGGRDTTTRFLWRISYGARAGPLRTPQELARAFASNVREETLFVQQCVLDG